MAAVYEDGKLHTSRAPVCEKRLDRGANRAAAVKHVVDDHDGRSVEREVDLGRIDLRRLGALAEIVAVEADVKQAKRDFAVSKLV